MAVQSKFFKLNPNILVEYIYNNENNYSENYNIITDLNTTEKLYVPNTSISKSKLSTNLLLIDPVLNRYTIYDPSFNFYQKQDFFTAPVPHDTIRIYLPIGFNFLDNGYSGLHLKTYSLNYNNKKKMVLSSYFFDDQDTKRQTEISLGNSFLYDEKQWGKYIQYDIPSPYYVSKQRITNPTQNYPTPYSINVNLDSLGMNDTTPIMFDFSFIISTTTTFGVKYYNLGELYRTSISKVPEYQNLAVQIAESTNGDFFEIYGTYGNSNENLDDFVEELRAKSQQIKIQYIVSLYEENILQRTQTYEIEENFSQKVYYRPIIMFSNTTAAINVEMKVTDLVNMSSFSRMASLGLTKNLFKYGRNLTRIELSNAYKPKLYNTKPSTVNMQGGLNSSAVIDITKVNYPLLIDKFNVLVGPNNSNGSESNSLSDYKSTGLLQIILTQFDNIIKFNIAKQITKDNTIEPLNLAELLVNAELTIIFKSDDQFIERGIFNETGDNDLTQGIVVFKITEPDIITIKKIQKNNNNFFLTIKSKNTNVRTQLFSGKFILFDELKFYDNAPVTSNIPTTKITDNLSLTPTINDDTLVATLQLTSSDASGYDPNNYRNLLVYLSVSATPIDFENFLDTKGLKKNVYIKYNYSYFILTVPKTTITEIANLSYVEKIVQMTFELGKNKIPTLSPKDRRIYEIEDAIRNTPEWIDKITQNALKEGMPLNEAIHLNAVWVYDEEQKKKVNTTTKDNKDAEIKSLQERLDQANNRIADLVKTVAELKTPVEGNIVPTRHGSPSPTDPEKYAVVAVKQYAFSTPGSITSTGDELIVNHLYKIVQSMRKDDPDGGNAFTMWYKINTNISGNNKYGWISEDNCEIRET